MYSVLLFCGISTTLRWFAFRMLRPCLRRPIYRGVVAGGNGVGQKWLAQLGSGDMPFSWLPCQPPSRTLSHAKQPASTSKLKPLGINPPPPLTLNHTLEFDCGILTTAPSPEFPPIEAPFFPSSLQTSTILPIPPTSSAPVSQSGAFSVGPAVFGQDGPPQHALETARVHAALVR